MSLWHSGCRVRLLIRVFRIKIIPCVDDEKEEREQEENEKEDDGDK